MRQVQDVLMSVKRYMALALGPEWEVRLWSDEGSFKPPLARVAESAPTQYDSRRVATDLTQALQVHCYQHPAETATLALRDARAVEEKLTVAVEVGVDLAWPRRIPLYDYEGKGPGEPSNDRNTYDFVRVVDFSVNHVQDGDDPTIVVVVADIRVRWSRATTVDMGLVTVNSLRVEERAS